MNLRFSKVAAQLLVGASLVIACGDDVDAADSQDNANGENTEQGAQINRSGALEQDFELEDKSISFKDGRYSGNTGCNNFSGSYVWLSEDTVEVQPMVLTRKACVDQKLMRDEAQFAQNFPGEYKVLKQGATVVLLNDERSWVFATPVN